MAGLHGQIRTQGLATDRDLWMDVRQRLLVPMLAFANSKIIPLILELILTVLFLVLLRRLARKSAAEACDTANDY